MTLFLSAGHNPKGKKTDSGAVSNNHKEADINIEFRNLLLKELKTSNINIVQDNDDETLSQYLTRIQPDSNSLILEFHCDASTNPLATGTTAIIAINHTIQSRKIAIDLVTKTSEILQIKNRGIYLENQTHVGKLPILRKKGHSCLLELFFLTNKNDFEQYQKHKITLAKEISAIITNHINSI